MVSEIVTERLGATITHLLLVPPLAKQRELHSPFLMSGLSRFLPNERDSRIENRWSGLPLPSPRVRGVRQHLCELSIKVRIGLFVELVLLAFRFTDQDDLLVRLVVVGVVNGYGLLVGLGTVQYVCSGHGVEECAWREMIGQGGPWTHLLLLFFLIFGRRSLIVAPFLSAAIITCCNAFSLAQTHSSLWSTHHAPETKAARPRQPRPAQTS